MANLGNLIRLYFHRFYHAFTTAARRNCKQIVEYLLSNQENVDKREFKNAIYFGFAKIGENGHFDLLKFLFENFIDRITDDELEATCWNACRTGHIEIVKYLIERRPHIVNRMVLSPIIENEQKEVFKYLIDNGYDLEFSKLGYLYYEIALRTKDEYYIQYLLDKLSKRDDEIIHLQRICNGYFQFWTKAYFVSEEEALKRKENLRNEVKCKLMALLGTLPVPGDCMTVVINYLV